MDRSLRFTFRDEFDVKLICTGEIYQMADIGELRVQMKVDRINKLASTTREIRLESAYQDEPTSFMKEVATDSVNLLNTITFKTFHCIANDSIEIRAVPYDVYVNHRVVHGLCHIKIHEFANEVCAAIPFKVDQILDSAIRSLHDRFSAEISDLDRRREEIFLKRERLEKIWDI